LIEQLKQMELKMKKHNPDIYFAAMVTCVVVSALLTWLMWFAAPPEWTPVLFGLWSGVTIFWFVLLLYVAHHRIL
jgi:hypothetical protein